LTTSLSDDNDCDVQSLSDAISGHDPAVDAWEALTRVLVGMAAHSTHAGPPGMTFPQIRLLLILNDLGRVPSSRLAAALGVSASSVTRLADRLEARGLLARGGDEHNRCVVTVEVTESGRRVVAQVLGFRHAALRAVLDRMPAGQREAAALAAHRFAAAAVLVDATTSAPQ
jgi:DNA-binding MarR family transcriptional regulator